MGTYVHGDKTDGDDEAVLLLTFEGGAIGLAEESWNKPGGMDDRAEVYGSAGQAYADLLHGNALRAFSRHGYGYAVEKAGTTAGWSFPIYEEIWNYGFPQEMEHFVTCVRQGTSPREDGHDGRAVVEAVHALYASAAQGRRIELPFPSTMSRPIEQWRPGGSATIAGQRGK
jgi:predicted dehydrogenase